jgi:hypothetical protein
LTIKREWQPCRRGSHGRILFGFQTANLRELYLLQAKINTSFPSDIDILVFNLQILQICLVYPERS